MTNVQKTIPIREGLWSETASSDGKPRLLGHQCSKCGEVFFPKKDNGICTYCHSTKLKELPLSPKGKIHTFSVVMLRPPGGYYRGEVPYALGYVGLEEGVLVETLFTGCDSEKIRVGMEVELVLEKLHDDEGGNEVITYKFRPIGS
ncbi:MAG: Zn-ribbon domain-containing OB-fold protein [Deltaproteobacteria bacterium]|nr:Zn-ribbon domain-containing OB-fold protein [Deltaproteobacteria bacterium]